MPNRMIPKGVESTHLRETPLKKTSKSHVEVNEGGCTKIEKIGCPIVLKTRPIFLFAESSQLFFYLLRYLSSSSMCESCLGRGTTNKEHCLAKLKTHSHSSLDGRVMNPQSCTSAFPLS